MLPLALVAAAGLAILLRLPVLEMTLDRDLAAYATVGQNLVDGLLPYRDLFDHKQPLTYGLFALLDVIAPQSTAAVRVAAALVAAGTAWLVLVLVRRQAGWALAATAALVTLVIGASDFVEGAGVNTEHVLALVSVATLVAALAAHGGSRAAAAGVGVLFGLAVLSKAVGVFIAPAAALPLLAGADRLRRLAAFAGGACVPLVGVVGFYAATGGLEDLWFDNIAYNRAYVGPPLTEAGANLLDQGEIALLAGAALVAAAQRLASRSRDVVTWTLVLWLAGATAGALTSGRGYAHYFAPMVAPAVCLLFVAAPTRGTVRVAVTAAVALVVVLPFAGDVADHYGTEPRTLSLEFFGFEAHQTWEDAEVLGPIIRRRATPTDRLYAQGSEPNVYWLSGLRPASKFFYNLPVELAPERWRRQVERDVCGSPSRLPRFLVRQRGPTPRDEPSCLRHAPYARVATHGLSTLYELAPAARADGEAVERDGPA